MLKLIIKIPEIKVRYLLNKHAIVLLISIFIILSLISINKLFTFTAPNSFYNGFLDGTLYTVAIILGAGILYLSKILGTQNK